MTRARAKVQSPGLNPFHDMLDNGFGGLESALQNADPLLKGVARWQLEMLGLASRRAQAYLEVPSKLSRCRTHQDIAAVQVDFWQTAFGQYMESSRRIASAWSQMASTGMRMGMPEQPAERTRSRDYIAVGHPAPVAKKAPTSSEGQGHREARPAVA